MSEAKWTAGPWSIVRYGDGSSLVIHSDTDNRVCFMATASSDRPTSHAKIRANARLIAAAPDLFACLTAAVEIIDKWIEPETMGVVRSGDGVLGHYLRDEYLMNFRAALSRALPQGTEEGR